jgi:hypothetical protein
MEERHPCISKVIVPIPNFILQFGMPQITDPLEILWDNLLSREAPRIRMAFNSLSRSDQSAILSHLNRMSNEEAWHPEQRASARAALDALENQI